PAAQGRAALRTGAELPGPGHRPGAPHPRTGRPPQGHGLMRRSELMFALVAVLIMAGAWVLDGVVPSKTSAPPVAASAATPPLSEAWYCPAPTARGLGSTVWTATLATGPVHVRRSGTGASGAAAEADLGAGAFAGIPAAPSTGQTPVAVEAFGGA